MKYRIEKSSKYKHPSDMQGYYVYFKSIGFNSAVDCYPSYITEGEIKKIMQTLKADECLVLDDNEKWYELKANNKESIYGYGTYDNAQKYCDYLNRNREINCYEVYELMDDEILYALTHEKHTDGFNFSDIDYDDLTKE